jgi:hypothetical protein
MEEGLQALSYYRKLPPQIMEAIYGMVEERFDIDPMTVYRRLEGMADNKEQGLGVTESRPRFFRMDIRNALYKARRHYRDTTVHNYAQRLIERLQDRSIQDPQFKYRFRNGKFRELIVSTKHKN